MNFKEELSIRTGEAEEIIRKYLPKEEGFARPVTEAMNYAVMGGGKRLRPVLMREAYRLFGGTGEVIEPFMAAMEFVHTYSLVHDDLPAMDDDEYRRGRKTTHVVYGEALGILAGDGLLNYAFETAAKGALTDGSRRAVKALDIFASKSGIYGMVGGQTADIVSENAGDEAVTEELLYYIHEHKTAALIESSLMVGACLAGADDRALDILRETGSCVGVAFQIQDDILDVTGDETVLGKPVGSDEKNSKVTYVTLKGLKQAQKDQQELSRRAVELLDSLEGDKTFLKELILSLVNRDR